MRILPGMPKRGMNKAAYRGNLNCPACFGTSVRYIENLGPYMQRWRCRKCGLAFRYDISARFNHPYASFKGPIFRNIQGRKK